MLPRKVIDPGRSAQDNRQCVQAVLWVACTGSRWHALVDGLGRLARCSLSLGQVHDSLSVSALLEGLNPSAVVTDKADDTRVLLQIIAATSAKAVISFIHLSATFCWLT